MQFEVLAIEFDFEDEFDVDPLTDEEIEAIYDDHIGMLVEADDEYHLIKEITSTTGWHVQSIEYKTMPTTISTTQLLDFLVKADKVSTYVNFKKDEVNKEYDITIHADWDENDHFCDRTTSISEEGYSNWETSDFEFFTMNSMLDELVKAEEEREIKRQKRQELLSRLTDEEKELLGVR